MASGRKIIVVGDKNSSGGTVIGGAPQHTIGGRFIARLYDSVDCPGKYTDGSPHGVNPIIEGEERMPINGIPVALEATVKVKKTGVVKATLKRSCDRLDYALGRKPLLPLDAPLEQFDADDKNQKIKQTLEKILGR
jgi:uncharacterized Zn-binding protein involved in type VI secretion